MSFINEPITLQTLFGKKRIIGPITVQVLTREVSTDRITITKQPVQQGAQIADHAYSEPTDYNCTIFFEDNPFVSLSKVYQQLLDLQNSFVPFNISTPKRVYKNMLMTVLSCPTDKATENSLQIDMSCEHINIVSVATTNVPRVRQKNPGATGATQPAGKKSVLKVANEGVTSLFHGGH